MSIFKSLKFLASVFLATVMVPAVATAADLLDPAPIAEQSAPVTSSAAVDGVNWELSVLGGAYQRNVLGTASNGMFIASLSSPIPFFSDSFGMQIDAGAGIYDGDFTSSAAALHLFYRDPNTGMIGIYGDWAYVDPEHGGRVGVELSSYNGRWTLDALVGMQFGQHFETGFIDEVDLSYYFTDNFRASIGHRLTSRGHVGNISFESLVPELGVQGLSVFGEFEAGEDNYVGGFGGVRLAFGSGASNSGTLIERDRQASVQVRIPRNITSVTQCGDLDVPKPATSLRGQQTNLCASEDEINAVSTPGITKLR
ncbi:MAG: hypothetical protein JJ891_15045 [Rhizobiaceae bacterium]|nr:hypothetical protein [Rhizobiaceae bacterium]